MRAAIVVLVVAGALGCGPRYGPEDNPTMLMDASGGVFGWACTDEGCRIQTVAGTPPPADCGPGRPVWGLSWGPYFEICTACSFSDSGSWSTTAGECRILACEVDADCPVLFRYVDEPRFVCMNGLCRNDDLARFPRDAPLDRRALERLCLAEVPREETLSPLTPRSVEILAAIDAACPPRPETGPCTLPPTCRAP